MIIGHFWLLLEFMPTFTAFFNDYWAFLAALQFTASSGRHSVLERPLSEAKRPLIFN